MQHADFLNKIIIIQIIFKIVYLCQTLLYLLERDQGSMTFKANLRDELIGLSLGALLV